MCNEHVLMILTPNLALIPLLLSKGLASDNTSIDTSKLETSEKIAQLAKQPPIDTEAVARIKNAIADGKYPIDIDAVSDALMDAYRDMKS